MTINSKKKTKMAKTGKKDNSMLSYETHELQSMAEKTGITHHSFIGVIKRKLGTNNPVEIENYINELKTTGYGLIISYKDLFGSEDLVKSS